MARWLTPLRAALGAAALGGLVGLAGLYSTAPVDHPLRDRPPEERHRRNAERTALAAAETWILRERLAGLQRELGAGTPHSVTVVLDASFPSEAGASIQQRVADAWVALGLREHDTRTIVVISSDTGGTIAGIDRGLSSYIASVIHVLPEDTAGFDCVTSINVPQRILESSARTRAIAQNIAPSVVPGLCGFVATFGRPGREIAEWLHETRARFAGSTDWRTPPQRHTGEFDDARRLSAAGGVYARQLFGCVAGREAACAAWLHQSIGSHRGVTEEQGAIGTVVWSYAFSWGRSRSVASLPEMMAALVHEGGEAPFRQFWTSTRSLEEAFGAAYGESLQTWASRWARATFGNPPIEMLNPWRALPGTFLLIVLSVVGATAYASRRTVS